MLRQLKLQRQKNEGRAAPHTTHRQQLRAATDLSVRAEAVKLLEKNANLHDLELDSDFIYTTPKHTQNQEKTAGREFPGGLVARARRFCC